jgi:hypothetical protein
MSEKNNKFLLPLLATLILSSLSEKVAAQVSGIFQINTSAGSVYKVDGQQYGNFFKLPKKSNHDYNLELKAGPQFGPLRLWAVVRPSFGNTTTFNPWATQTHFRADGWGVGGFVWLGIPVGECNSCDGDNDGNFHLSVDLSYTHQAIDGTTDCGCDNPPIHQEATASNTLRLQLNIWHKVFKLFWYHDWTKTPYRGQDVRTREAGLWVSVWFN